MLCCCCCCCCCCCYFFVVVVVVVVVAVHFVLILITFDYISQVDVGIFQDTTIGDRKINFVATRLILINSDEVIN